MSCILGAAETGYGGQHTLQYKRQVVLARRRRLGARALLAGCACALVWAGAGAWAAQWARSTDRLFIKMETLSPERAGDGPVVCVSTRHVGVTGVDWVAFPALGLRLMGPVLLGTNGTTVSTVEEVDLRACAAGEPVRARRHVRVRVGYSDARAAASARSVDLEGDAAYCIQHMLDIFSGRIPCLPPSGGLRRGRGFEIDL